MALDQTASRTGSLTICLMNHRTAKLLRSAAKVPSIQN